MEVRITHAKQLLRFTDMTVEAVGAECGMEDANYFSRLFKKQMGITCIEYLTQKRIERARKLLERTEMKHQAIAQAVGYASVYYFSLQFKKQTGETPGQYRKRVGKKDDSDD